MVKSVESRQEVVRMEPLMVDGGACSTQRQVKARHTEARHKEAWQGKPTVM